MPCMPVDAMDPEKLQKQLSKLLKELEEEKDQHS